MEEPILSVRNLSVSFGTDDIFKNLDFEVKRGETAAIIGPNGAGKTVLFKALIESISSKGEIIWAPDTRIGYVPQRLDLERTLSITLGDFLALKTSILHLSKHFVRDAAQMVHLPPSRLKNPLAHLSGGELQRALIAFALIGSPDVLLFDEPTAGVDLPGEEQIYQTLHHLQDERRITLIFISHDLNLVYRYADKVICMNRAMFCFGSPQETLTPTILDKLYGAQMIHHFHQHE